MHVNFFFKIYHAIPKIFTKVLILKIYHKIIRQMILEKQIFNQCPFSKRL